MDFSMQSRCQTWMLFRDQAQVGLWMAANTRDWRWQTEIQSQWVDQILYMVAYINLQADQCARISGSLFYSSIIRKRGCHMLFFCCWCITIQWITLIQITFHWCGRLVLQTPALPEYHATRGLKSNLYRSTENLYMRMMMITSLAEA